MSAHNRHVIEITGTTLREISETALDMFDAFFNREVQWHVIEMDTQASFVTAKNGVGEVIARSLLVWEARVVAEAVGVRIGAQKHEAAMLFRPLGT